MKPRVLIVEDETSLSTLLRYNLEREGFEVAEAADGEEALIAVEENRPDLIVLDWMLPGMSGIAFTRLVRQNARTKSIPIIMLTARGAEEDKVLGLEIGRAHV